MRDGQKIGYPHQRKDLDLSKDPRDVRDAGGKAPSLGATRADDRCAQEMMRQLGFEPSKYMTPLQFMLAVMNDDLDKIYKNEIRRKRMEQRGGISMQYRSEAAKTAARYLHMQMPTITVSKDEGGSFGDELSNAINSGNQRVERKTIIMETIERISPNVPLPTASYPPVFSSLGEGELIEQEMPEGDTEYDPDNE